MKAVLAANVTARTNANAFAFTRVAASTATGMSNTTLAWLLMRLVTAAVSRYSSSNGDCGQEVSRQGNERAEQIGLDPDGALTGSGTDAQADDQLESTIEDIDVFARVTPEHKGRLLNALQGNGHTVVMTGDGVNHAPALTQADVGVAMGERGTDVAQQASDMILWADNFATTRDTIPKGRGIFENVRKIVDYLVSTNTGEVLMVFLGRLLCPAQFPGTSEALILTPFLILWIDLVAESAPCARVGR